VSSKQQAANIKRGAADSVPPLGAQRTPSVCLRACDSRSCGPLVVIDAPTIAVRDAARKLGLRYYTRSGRTADGGPGHRVQGHYGCTRQRYERDEYVRLGMQLIVAANSGQLDRQLELQNKLRTLDAPKKHASNDPRRN
jgi:hypothetical protein